MKKNKNLTYFDQILNKKYGLTGTERRNKFEQEFEAFKLGVLIEQARKKKKMTQSELADNAEQTSLTFLE